MARLIASGKADAETRQRFSRLAFGSFGARRGASASEEAMQSAAAGERPARRRPGRGGRIAWRAALTQQHCLSQQVC